MKNKIYSNCKLCKEGTIVCNIKTSVGQLVDMKSRGRLIYANQHFFNLIFHTETCFVKYARNANVFDLTVADVLENYNFTFPCKEHGSDILAYAIYYYVRLRMRQYTFQENQKLKKQSAIKRKYRN